MTILNGVDTRAFGNTAVINGGKQARINANYPYEYDKWRMVWNGYHFAPPDAGSVLYLPGIPGAGSTIQDFSFNFTDSTIDTDEELDTTETDVNCDDDATTAIPINSVIRVESELMLVTATGTTLTVTRGYLGSIAATHTTNQDIFRWLPNHGTITDATWKRLPSGLSVLNFDGDDYVNCGNNTSLDASTALTIEAWVMFTGTQGAYQAIVGKATSYLFAYHDVADKIFLFVRDGSNYSRSDVVSLVLNTWYHIAVLTTDGTTATTAGYINGVSINLAQVVAGSLLINTQNVYLGADSTYGDFAKARIALPRIYPNYALSSTIISNHYNQERHLFGI